MKSMIIVMRAFEVQKEAIIIKIELTYIHDAVSIRVIEQPIIKKRQFGV